MFGPKMVAGFGFQKLRRHPDLAAGLPHTAFEDVPDAELAADNPNVLRAVLVCECGVAGDHKEPLEPAKGGSDVLGNPVAEERLARIATHVVERQHCDRRSVRHCQRGRFLLRARV